MSEPNRAVAKKASAAELPVFVNEENRAKLMAIYDQALQRWGTSVQHSS